MGYSLCSYKKRGLDSSVPAQAERPHVAGKHAAAVRGRAGGHCRGRRLPAHRLGARAAPQGGRAQGLGPGGLPARGGAGCRWA